MTKKLSVLLLIMLFLVSILAFGCMEGSDTPPPDDGSDATTDDGSDVNTDDSSDVNTDDSTDADDGSDIDTNDGSDVDSTEVLLVEGAAVGNLVPNFTLNDMNGEPVELQSFQGEKAVLLVFWSPG